MILIICIRYLHVLSVIWDLISLKVIQWYIHEQSTLTMHAMTKWVVLLTRYWQTVYSKVHFRVTWVCASGKMHNISEFFYHWLTMLASNKCNKPGSNINHGLSLHSSRPDGDWHIFHFNNCSENYHKTYNIRRILVCNKTVGHSHAVGASPVGAAPTTSSHST